MSIGRGGAILFALGFLSVGCAPPANSAGDLEPTEQPKARVHVKGDVERAQHRGMTGEMGQHMRAMHELHVQMHERRREMLQIYEWLEDDYAELEEEQGELGEQLTTGLEQMRAMADRIEERHQLVEERLRQRTEEGADGGESEPRGRGEMHGGMSPYHRMMGDGAHLEEIVDEHEEMVTVHEEMASANREEDRERLAESHEELGGHHADMAGMGDQILEMMQDRPAALKSGKLTTSKLVK